MSKSVWKGPFVSTSLLTVGKENIWSRGSVILPHFLGETVKIYNGSIFVTLLIKSWMLGYKFGDFAVTKRIGRKIHEHKRKKNLKKGQKKRK